VLVDGLLTRKQTAVIAGVSYFIGAGLGLVIVEWRQFDVLWIGLAGTFCAFFYQSPPVKLSYRGLGELAVAISYGPLICCGTYLVQRGRIDIEPLLVSVPLGLLIANFLWVDEFPDCTSDSMANKRTLVVRLGRKRASFVFPFIFAVAFGVLLTLPAFGLPKQIVLGGLALIPAVAAVRRVLQHPNETAKIIPAQGQTLLAVLLYSVGSGAGFLVS
jgi:1,4-dihydroxy-2-naphthoate polyprenyltransferase